MKINLIYILVAFVFVGCQTVEYRHTTLPNVTPLEEMQGIYHKVEKGQTLWRIAKTYGVAIDDIIRLNNIPNAALIEENQLLFVPNADAQKSVSSSTTGAGGDDFAWPIKGDVITFFDQKQGIYRSRGIHIRANPGNTVRASREGRVVFADYLNGYAQTVILDHQDGFYSVYGNNARLSVKLGDYVLKEAELARVGSVGNQAYLHYEIRRGHRASNPLFYLP